MKLLFIISGSIAAKKSLNVIKILNNKNIYIDCIITNNAKKIINLNLLKKLIKGKVYSNSSEKNNNMLHIQLTRKSDLVVICPATANIISKIAHGHADDLASTSLIASNKQILVVPAMNVEMWNNTINLKNVKKLRKIGIEFIGPEYGFLSCGEIGLGRLSDEKKISNVIWQYLANSKKLSGKKCIVTAGPTIESIDAVRYISNFSSGKQGYEIAKQLTLAGAKVILISGPTHIPAPVNVKIIKVKTAKEMDKIVKKYLPVDIAIFAAAVTDVKPKNYKNHKIKKDKLENIILTKNPDIIKNTCSNKKLRPELVVGFAVETEKLIVNSLKKIKSKACDWIIANELGNNNQVFGSDFNKVNIIKKNIVIKLKKMTKNNISKKIVQEIIKYFEFKKSKTLEEFKN